MVEIIPKPVKEIPRWQKILFYSSIVFTALLILALFILGSIQRDSQYYIQSLEEKLSEGKTPQRMALEKQVLDYKAKIDNFSPYMAQHVISSNLFEFLESKTHPRVFFSEISSRPRDSKVILSGLTDSFLSLGQQVLILNEEPSVESLELKNVSLSVGGGIGFSLEILLNVEIFRY